jgi:hypothetical protein
VDKYFVFNGLQGITIRKVGKPPTLTLIDLQEAEYGPLQESQHFGRKHRPELRHHQTAGKRYAVFCHLPLRRMQQGNRVRARKTAATSEPPSAHNSTRKHPVADGRICPTHPLKPPPGIFRLNKAGAGLESKPGRGVHLLVETRC